MDTFLTYTALGLVVGAIYAIAASGLVLTYTTSGIFNFAHGAQAMIGAFTFYQARVVWELPTWLALVVVLGVLGPGMGWLLHTLIMRRLRDTEIVTRVVVTVAVLLGLVSLSQWVWNPQEGRVPPMLFGADSTVDLLGVTLRYHQVLCVVIAAAIAVALWWLFNRTRIGVLMRAAVDDPELLKLSGHDPDRISASAWMIGSTLAVLAGVLVTPVMGGTLEANALTLLVVDAFAAALFGRLRSIPLTFVGAVVLGLGSTYLVGYAPAEWTWVGNFQRALPMVVLFVVLLLLPHERLRGTATRSRERYQTPPLPRAALWAVACVIGLVAFGGLISEARVGTLLVGLSFAVIALSVVLLTGYAGELNLAPLGFAAVATLVAYHVGSDATAADPRLSLTGLVAGVAVAAITGALVALPALRLRGLYLALATLAFSGIVSAMLLRDTTPRTLFGHTFVIFPNGNILMPPLEVGPLDLADATTFLWVLSTLFATLGLGVVALRNSSYGRRLAAMKDSPAAAAMLGQRLMVLKLGVFALSTGIAGLGGIFMSMAVVSVSAETFGFTVSLSLVMLTVVCGIGYVSGALVAGLIAGAGITSLQLVLGDIALTHPEYRDTFDIVHHLLLVATALVGIGVANGPSGFLHDVFERQRGLARVPFVRWGGAAVQVALLLAAYAGLLGPALLLFVSVVLWSLLPAVATAWAPDRARPLPLELEGITTPNTLALRQRIDRELRIETEAGHARA
ncbi:ABC transporter permease [Nocardioides sp.]|uniref:branched-chain amino acid ABC transporter permease n=1 Tax=Nocardioides sp. TaxID=35761 RepID=UPI0025EF7A6A|nr:ABC transporter permease [Nocardioides sp.]